MTDWPLVAVVAAFGSLSVALVVLVLKSVSVVKLHVAHELLKKEGE